MFKIYDLEVLRDYFLYIDLDLKEDKFTVFEISKFKNDLRAYIDHLAQLAGQVGFNSLGYDAQIQQYILDNYKHWDDYTNQAITDIIYKYSQRVISITRNNSNPDNKTQWPDYRDGQFTPRQLDLYKVWHYDNKARSCSLKWLEYSMDWLNIEDMPIDHTESISSRQKADLVIEYCKNDCLATREFHNISRGKTENTLYKGIDKIQLRKDVQKEFGFNCLNFSDVKIGDQINRVNYAKAIGIEAKDVRRPQVITPAFTFGDCFPEGYHFETAEFNSLLDKMRDIRINFSEKQDFKFKFGKTEYTFAKGGMHSEDRARIIKPNNNEILRDADVGSMYPNFIRKKRLYPKHLGEKWLEGYTDIINKRLEAKQAYKKTKEGKYKSLDEAFKLALNGGSFGKTNEKSNWQYDPIVTFKVTIGCQIELLMLIEQLQINGINVISANTDGVVCLFDRDKEELYNTICKQWEINVGNDVVIKGTQMGALEYADYKLYAQLSVNDYIAIKEDGTTKEKGSFMTDYELHKNKSFKIVPLALQQYYKFGSNAANFIRNHDNILDFCAGVRAKGDWYFELRSLKNGQYKVEKLQKTNRVFVSNEGSKLIKCHSDGREIQQNAGKWMCTLFNKYEKRVITEYDINYDFYIRKVYDIISEIEPHIINEYSTQMSLF